jgi:hypothetical protein
MHNTNIMAILSGLEKLRGGQVAQLDELLSEYSDSLLRSPF